MFFLKTPSDCPLNILLQQFHFAILHDCNNKDIKLYSIYIFQLNSIPLYKYAYVNRLVRFVFCAWL